MIKKFFMALVLLGLTAAGNAVAPNGARAETQETIHAIVAWTGNGKSYEVGADHAVFVGALEGPLYVQTDKGWVPAGTATCPMIVDVDTTSAAQTAQGRCIVENPDGDMMFAEVTCRGVYRVGCDGTMTLTGGTGAFEGITGGGEITVRSERRSVVESGNGTTEEEGVGIMVIEGLTYTLP
jgi:hypothetical protein